MIGISWGNPIRAAWELGIGIAQADPIFSQSCIVARPHYSGRSTPPPLQSQSYSHHPHECCIEGVDRPHLGSNLTTPPLVASVFTLQPLGRTRTRTDTARPPPLVVPGLPSALSLDSSDFAGRAAAASAVVALGVVGLNFDVWSWTNTIVQLQGDRLPISHLITASTCIARSRYPPPNRVHFFLSLCKTTSQGLR
ncbi:hypothetical protein PGTUg99_022346 [Puccinia graminis f. sp. tritici]|uniref:Uncharacterized protein n=1 Tax=Puccinia graminis f. sp. tritici TaxID=56615 RepID=A0A5B0PGK7_PUCGR|nr:hypothetical protein PGTUg99_022346 [Puccinia graminis f. sp. tritici]